MSGGILTGSSVSSSRSALLADQSAGSGGLASFDFTSISQDYMHLRIYLIGKNEADSTAQVRMRFNNDSATNYEYKRYLDNSLEEVGQSSMLIGEVARSSASFFSHNIIEIPFYTTTAHRKMAFGMFFQHDGTARAGSDCRGLWTEGSSVVITRVTLFVSGSTDFIQDSRAIMYGVV